ncbi:cobalt ECF transporter T component CbiQ [Cyanobacterium stanieri LEGE 03274]|uniref:Cobalt ECF transporter T component CbiQ n=1 Tax=Cyanobacterium stanieri LEGE 03274 TaxID=1828756 RepID=A0ABR9V4W9_9CHRO|nr:cobalt ECF transporter T component CbiQ [Cyanobacterium stanieri]MBE9221884.1 cobalt ECF transporter T component CbiQ [Cyanobacterium stanieri LEGE 03274]
MKLFLDRYAYLNSPIHRWEQKPKFIALMSLIMAFSFINKLKLLPVMVLTTVFFFVISKLPITFLISRLRYPGLFIIGLIIFLPFVIGENIIFNWSFISVKIEGILMVIVIIIRFLSILTISLILFATAPFISTLKTLQSLGLSPIINDMMLLTYRYLEQMGDRLLTMEKALQLKGFKLHKLSRRNLKIIANLIASLLIRSYEESKLVYQAMILRGYGIRIKQDNYNYPSIKSVHWLACYGVVLISLTLIFLEYFL